MPPQELAPQGEQLSKPTMRDFFLRHRRATTFGVLATLTAASAAVYLITKYFNERSPKDPVLADLAREASDPDRAVAFTLIDTGAQLMHATGGEAAHVAEEAVRVANELGDTKLADGFTTVANTMQREASKK